MLRRDVAHAVRAVMRRPGSSLGAILMLAAGLAAVAASSGLASTLLFRPISTRYPDEVRRLASSDLAGRTRLAFSEVELERVRDSLAGRCEHRRGEPSAGRAAHWRHRHADAGRSRGRPLLRHDRPRRRGGPAARRRRCRCRRTAGGRDQRRALAAIDFAAIPRRWAPTIRLNGRAFTIVGVTAGKSTSTLPGRQRRRLDHARACGRDARPLLAHQSRQSMVDDSRSCRRGGRGESGRGARARHRRSRDAAPGSVARAQADHGARAP